jgi:hypothetical protein
VKGISEEKTEEERGKESCRQRKMFLAIAKVEFYNENQHISAKDASIVAVPQ